MEVEPEKIAEKIYSSYTDAQKRATNKYREANKEKVNAQRKKYYEERKEKDPNFLQYKRDKAKEYYLKKKGELVVKENEEPNIELVKITEPTLTFPCNEEDVEKYIQEKAINNITVEPIEDDTPPFDNLEKVKPVKKYRAKKEQPKTNLQLQDLQDLVDQIVTQITQPEIIEDVPSVPKTPKVKGNRKRTKTEIIDVLHSV